MYLNFRILYLSIITLDRLFIQNFVFNLIFSSNFSLTVSFKFNLKPNVTTRDLYSTILHRTPQFGTTIWTEIKEFFRIVRWYITLRKGKWDACSLRNVWFFDGVGKKGASQIWWRQENWWCRSTTYVWGESVPKVQN